MHFFDKKFSLEEKIDPAMMDMSKRLNIKGLDITIGELHDLFPYKESRYSLFVDFEDMCVYTSIGLLSVINELYKLKIPLDLKQFTDRDIPVRSVDYICKLAQSYNLPKQKVLEIYKKEFPEICARSPTTKFYDNMMLLKQTISSITINFPNERNDLSDLMKEMQMKIFYNRISPNYIVFKDDEEKANYLLGTKHDLFVIYDLGFIYNLFLKFNIKNKSIMTYGKHNGMDPYLMYFYLENFPERQEAGINNISLTFLNEIL